MQRLRSRSRRDCCCKSIAVPCSGGNTALLTALIAIKYARHSYQIDGHAKLGICLDVQRLVSRQARCISRARILSACKSSARNLEKFRRMRWWRQSIGISNARDVVLVNDSRSGCHIWWKSLECGKCRTVGTLLWRSQDAAGVMLDVDVRIP